MGQAEADRPQEESLYCEGGSRLRDGEEEQGKAYDVDGEAFPHIDNVEERFRSKKVKKCGNAYEEGGIKTFGQGEFEADRISPAEGTSAEGEGGKG
jgi:hypothetical protein